jgi:predicted short-subunit dehydrogenase-like oxidoreductase (DUF2520 family)
MVQHISPHKPLSVVLIGSGNVATHLGKAIKKSGNHIIQVYSYTLKSAKILATQLKTDYTSDIKALNADADLYVVAVKDDALGAVLNQITINKGIVVHTSGNTTLSVFGNKFKRFGVFYPLQTFSKNKKVNFKNIPICIESSDAVIFKELQHLGEQISEKVIAIDSNQRQKLHLAAVFACNFSNYMYTISDHILSDNGMSLDLLKPLILETAIKIKGNPPRSMQTGPAKRHDLKTIESHLKLLENSVDYHQIYSLLSKAIMKDFK